MNDFLQFATANGLSIEKLFPADKIMRCPTETHPHKKNGAYFYDGSRGWVWNWESGAGVQWWHDIHVQPWTDAQKRAWKEKQQRARIAKAHRQAAAARQCAAMMHAAYLEKHPYLHYKGFPDEIALVQRDGSLLIPMRDCISDLLVGAQIIRLVNNAWDKKFQYGQRSQGAVFKIGDKNAAETIFCEGYATGLSIRKAVQHLNLNALVMCCFSAQNMAYVANQVTAGKRWVFADNDRSGTGQTIAQAIGLPWIMSENQGEDANDVHYRRGLIALSRLILELRQKT